MRGTATKFYGRRNSYIQFPNRGRLDTRLSITLLAWIYHQGHAGPIFNYMPNGWGVHFWMVSPKTLFVRFTRRRGRRFTRAVSSRTVRYRTWQYVGATYDYRTGIARLFVNKRFVVSRRIGRFRLATNYPVRMGARIGDRRYFRGSISCMQVYKKALTAGQIIARRTRCFKRGTTFLLTHLRTHSLTNLLADLFNVFDYLKCLDQDPDRGPGPGPDPDPDRDLLQGLDFLSVPALVVKVLVIINLAILGC